jgi:hypothetical protein
MTRHALAIVLLCACGDDGGGGTVDAPPAPDGPATFDAPLDAPVETPDAPPPDATSAPVDAAVSADAAPFVGCDFTPPPGGGTCAGTGGGWCWELPGAALTVAGGAPDFACSAPIPVGLPSAVATGTVQDLQTGNGIAGALVSIYASADLSPGPIVSSASDISGAFSILYPSGTPDRPAWLVSATDALDTVFLDGSIDGSPVTLPSVSTLTANALPAFVGISRTPGTGLAVGRAADCAEPLQHAIATFSTTSSAGSTCPMFLPESRVYYFSGGSPSLPVSRATRIETSSDGQFVILETPPTDAAFVQIWGFLDPSDVALGYPALHLIAEIPVDIVGDTVLVGTLTPTEGPFPPT